MKKVYLYNNKDIEITTCKAIATAAGETEYQEAIYYHELEDENKDGDGVIFGFKMPESQEDFEAMMEVLGEECCFDSDYETLETVIILED